MISTGGVTTRPGRAKTGTQTSVPDTNSWTVTGWPIASDMEEILCSL